MSAVTRGGRARPQARLADLMRSNAGAVRLSQVFTDFCELAALAISNSVDRAQCAEREKRYLEVVRKYDRVEVDRFAEMLTVLIEWLAEGPADCLGSLYMSLDFGNERIGQYFSPYEISRLMAAITVADAKEVVARNGFAAVSEPTCGSGGMAIGIAEAFAAMGLNYQRHLHVIAQDIDITAVHMAYVQLSLHHIPAVVLHGNTLTMAISSQWFTPAHVLGGWSWRLRARSAIEAADPPAAAVQEPSPPASSSLELALASR